MSVFPQRSQGMDGSTYFEVEDAETLDRDEGGLVLLSDLVGTSGDDIDGTL